MMPNPRNDNGRLHGATIVEEIKSKQTRRFYVCPNPNARA